MPYKKTFVEIKSRDYWFKIVDFLQQNWALIDETTDGCMVFFFGDTSGVFDRLTFLSVEEAETALIRNGFARYAEEKMSKSSLPFQNHPFMNGHTPMDRSIHQKNSGVKGTTKLIYFF